MYEQIVEWLYLNDGNFGSKIAWRKAFLLEVKRLIEQCDKQG